MKHFAGVALVALCASCYAHQELDRNAPGYANLNVEPARPLVMPRDQGLQGVLLSGGAFGAGGPELGGRSPHAVGTAGLELSASYYTSPIGVFDPNRVPALDGLNLGYTLFGPDRAKDQLYLEVQHVYRLAGAAAGWSWDPLTNTNGPQLTLFYGLLYARLNYALGGGGEAQFGIFLKAFDRITWFR